MGIEKFYLKFNNTIVPWLLLVLILLIYGQTIFFHTNIDDHLVLDVTSGKIHTWQDLFNLFLQPFNLADYRPVATFTLGLENLIFGQLYPQVSHLVNVTLFYFISLLAYRVLNQLTNHQYRVEILWIVLLFISSTINTEVISSIKCRDNLLSMFFTLASIFFLTYDYKKNKIAWILAGLLMFYLAMLSKRDSIGLLILLPVYLFYKGKISKKKIYPVLLLAIGLLAVYIARQLLADWIVYGGASIKTELVRTTYTENPLFENFTPAVRWAALFQTNMIYIGKLLLPVDLRYYYGYNHYTFYTFHQYQLWLMIAVQLILLGLVIFYGRRNKYILLGFTGYIVFILYALNFFQAVAGIVADRYAFQCGIWFWLMLVLILKELTARTAYTNAWKYICLILVILYSGLSAYRASAWKDKMTLIGRDIDHLSRSYEAQRIAAATYLEQYGKTEERADLDKAWQHAKLANTIYPNNAVTHKIEGMILFQMNEFEKSKKQLLLSYRHDSTSSETLEMLGDITYVEKNYTNALKYYRAAFALSAASNELVNKISTVFYESGQLESCLTYNLNLIEQKPELWAPYENLGYFYLEIKDSMQAKKYFDLAKQKGLPDPTPL